MIADGIIYRDRLPTRAEREAAFAYKRRCALDAGRFLSPLPEPSCAPYDPAPPSLEEVAEGYPFKYGIDPSQEEF